MDIRELDKITGDTIEIFEEKLRDELEGLFDRMWEYDFSPPITYKEVLETLIKDELDVIANNYSAEGMSHLKKEELIDRLVKLVPENLNHILYKLDGERYELLRKIIGNNGYIGLEDPDHTKLIYFRSLGLIFTGWVNNERALLIPVEVMDAFKRVNNHELKTTVKRNTLWVNLTRGMLFYYGILEKDILIQNLEKYTKTKHDAQEVMEVISNASYYYSEMRSTEYGFRNSNIINEDKIRKEQQARWDIPYYNFTKKELLEAARKDYLDRTPQILEFSRHFKLGYDIAEDELDSFLVDIVNMINNMYSINDIIKMLEEHFEIVDFEQMHTISILVMEINNNTKMWILKGNSPNDLFGSQDLSSAGSGSTIVRTRRKIGRNEPCPCGSGKKYKRCCGRN